MKSKTKKRETIETKTQRQQNKTVRMTIDLYKKQLMMNGKFDRMINFD